MDYKIPLLFPCCLVSLIILSTSFHKWKGMQQGVCLIGLESFIFIVCSTTLHFPVIIFSENTSWNSKIERIVPFVPYLIPVFSSQKVQKLWNPINFLHNLRTKRVFFLFLRRNFKKWGKNFLEIYCRKKIIQQTIIFHIIDDINRSFLKNSPNSILIPN